MPCNPPQRAIRAWLGKHRSLRVRTHSEGQPLVVLGSVVPNNQAHIPTLTQRQFLDEIAREDALRAVEHTGAPPVVVGPGDLNQTAYL